MNQTYSAGGWRVGYAIFPPSSAGKAIQQTTLAYASECWSAASGPAQFASVEAFQLCQLMNQYRLAVASLHRHCTTRLYAALLECGLEVAKPAGAFYLYPSFNPYTVQLNNKGIRTSLELSKWLIEDCGIAALPGSAFGDDDEGCIGGRFRLRMATSYLYFHNEEEKYGKGYQLLDGFVTPGNVELPLLDEAIAAIKAAIEKLCAY